MYKYIAISGTIGAGKTELSKIFSERLNARLILEEFANNSFLERFYQNPDRYAFPLEISFLFERFQQQKVEFANAGIFEEMFISDYIFAKSSLFAKNNLTSDQFNVFYSLFTAFEEQLPAPDLVLYLYRPVEVLLDNIKKRGRGFEQSISAGYLTDIQGLYIDYFKKCSDKRIVVLNLGDIDFIDNDRIIDHLLQLITKEYKFGIQFIDL